MSLRLDAVAAYKSQQANRESEARTVLANCLTPEDVSALTVADTQVADTYVIFVFTDGDLDLAVRLRDGTSDVHLVKGQPGDWTNLATITSLAQLGEVLS